MYQNNKIKNEIMKNTKQIKNPLSADKRGKDSITNQSYLPEYQSAGFSTAPSHLRRPVAGFHRASPSTSLDKSINDIVLYFVTIARNNNTVNKIFAFLYKKGYRQNTYGAIKI